MSASRTQRRLAAILAADLVGYSRLMGQDEAGTLAALKAARTELIDPKIMESAGRVFKTTGDGLLAEFPSVVNAVSCAVEIQNGVQRRNDNMPEDKAIQLRIGINLGDIIVEGDDVFGDGVNVAARVESIAPPSGIAITETVRDHLGSRLNLYYEDIGQQTLKNIDRPIRVYLVKEGTGIRDAGTTPQRSEKPSIAVLPFENMSGDAEQEYFADGITEDFITELSRYKELHVSARHTSFHYKGKSPKINDLKQELGVGYVLEGSIRRMGSRVRITAQLIETAGCSHVWADRYDRDLSDIFAVQDELIAAIAATLEGRMVSAGAAIAQRKPTPNWSAYDYFLKGRDLANAAKEDEAKEYFAKAIRIDPNFAQAHAWLANCQVATYWLELRPELLREARSSAERALTLDNSDANSHHAMGMACLYARQLDRAGKHFNRAASLNPHDVSISGDRAQWLRFSGNFQEAHRVVCAAIERDAFPPVWLYSVRGKVLFHMRRFGEAVDDLSLAPNPRPYNLVYKVAALALLSDIGGAIREADALKAIKPGCTISTLTSWYPFADVSMLELVYEGLRKAKLPE
jgi:adenylate cyclase